jgi:glycosyltransferase involved in cell wall biosynthesis
MAQASQKIQSAEHVPLISIGLPVYNGEKYLAESVESILNQTFTDFELIISDNCSTDRTAEICRAFAKKSDKIRYFRQSENIGATANFEFTYQAAHGKYFRWQAHDDFAYPEFLERCLERLEADPDAVLCLPDVEYVDSDGHRLKVYSHRDNHTDDPDPINRFASRLRADGIVEIFGLMPREVLSDTERLGPFASHDRCLLAHLALKGRFLGVPEVLYAFRQHSSQFSQLVQTMETERSFKFDQLAVWFDPRMTSKPMLRRWTLLLRSIRYLHSVDLDTRSRLRGYVAILDAQRYRRNWRWLIREVRLLIQFKLNRLFASSNV